MLHSSTISSKISYRFITFWAMGLSANLLMAYKRYKWICLSSDELISRSTHTASLQMPEEAFSSTQTLEEA
jgi:hypothetical protein